jgi:hypothetical protein
MASIAGTYFTSWEYDITNQGYQLGPIVVIGTDNSVVVDGVTMNGAMVSGTMVSWSSGENNPSSAMLMFTIGTAPNPTTFSGTFWMSDEDPPSGTNFYGFDSQPQAPLSTWANTYYSYELVDGNNESLGNLVVADSTIIFSGTTIINPIYTGLYNSSTQQDTNELAWFTTDGNENNVAISFFSQSSGFNFNGNIWAAGASRPVGSAASVNNFFGTTQSAADADAVDAESVVAHVAEAVAVGLAVHAVFAAAKAAIGGNNQDDAADEAEGAADNVDNDAAPAEEAVGDADGGEDGAGDDGAGDDAADGGDEALDDIVHVAEDLIGLAATRNAAPSDTKGYKSKDASGLSSKQLLDLKDGE